jgi:hypothetical protein
MGRVLMKSLSYVALGAGALLACGGRATSNDLDELVPVTNGTGGGTSAGTAGTAGTGLATSGSHAAGGEPSTIQPKPEPPVQIAGRWAMFGFEDPVGIRLTQTNGQLVGRGCAAGVPPLDLEPSYCGDVNGTVEGNTAAFGFSFEQYHYQAETVISADGQRMTGRFHGASSWMKTPTAWLRVPADAEYLEVMGGAFEPEGLSGWYELYLLAGAGAEYEQGTPYRFHYSRRAIQGDLGSFWGSEATDPAAGSPIRVGPVSATSPELAIGMQIEFVASGLTQVDVTTGSGNTYTFSARRSEP